MLNPDNAYDDAMREGPGTSASTFGDFDFPDLKVGPEAFAQTIRSMAHLRSDPDLWTPAEPIVEDLLYRGRTTLIAAREKFGKTTLMMQVAAAISRGDDVIGRATKQSTVLWVGLDEGMNDALQRFAEFNADERSVFFSSEHPRSPERFAFALRERQFDVVVIDALGDLWAGIDSNSHDQTRGILMPYIRAARQTKAALCLIAHTNARGRKYAGAVSIGAMVDATLTLTVPGQSEDGDDDQLEQSRRELSGRTRHGPVRIELDFVNGRYEAAAKATVETTILSTLSSKPMSQRELRDRVGRRGTAVSSAVRQLMERGLVVSTPNGLIRSESKGDRSAVSDREPSDRCDAHGAAGGAATDMRTA